MTTLEDALDSLHAAAQNPEGLGAALDRVTGVAPDAEPAPGDLRACDDALRRVYRAMARLVSEELAGVVLAAPAAERDALDRRIEAALHVLRVRQQALLVWRREAPARATDDDDWHGAREGRTPGAWWLCASGR